MAGERAECDGVAERVGENERVGDAEERCAGDRGEAGSEIGGGGWAGEGSAANSEPMEEDVVPKKELVVPAYIGGHGADCGGVSPYMIGRGCGSWLARDRFFRERREAPETVPG